MKHPPEASERRGPDKPEKHIHSNEESRERARVLPRLAALFLTTLGAAKPPRN